MVSKTRAARIGERIREELSEVIIYGVQDPRLSGVSITDVRVDAELTFADVHFSAIEGSSRAPEIQNAFQHAQGFLRSELARRVDLRHFPRLRFHWDPTFEKAERIDKLIADLHRENEEDRSEHGS